MGVGMLEEGTGGEIVAEFVQMMKDWRRICKTIQSENQQTSSCSWCKGCPVQGVCVIDTEIKDTTDKGLAMICERIQSWAEKHPESVYPTWGEWLISVGAARKIPTGVPVELQDGRIVDSPWETVVDVDTPIPADIAQKHGIQPKEG